MLLLNPCFSQNPGKSDSTRSWKTSICCSTETIKNSKSFEKIGRVEKKGFDRFRRKSFPEKENYFNDLYFSWKLKKRKELGLVSLMTWLFEVSDRLMVKFLFIDEIILFNNCGSRAVVVAQLAERSLPTPEICGSNPDISKNIFERNYLSIAIQKKRRK